MTHFSPTRPALTPELLAAAIVVVPIVVIVCTVAVPLLSVKRLVERLRGCL